MMIHTEKATKKNDKTDDKLESLYIQEEVENQLSFNKAPRDELTIEDPARTFALQKSDTSEKKNTLPNIDDEGFITVSNKKKNNKKITKSRSNQDIIGSTSYQKGKDGCKATSQ
ncbi:17959_t:CDS:1 [Dentiscutata erythropus]|uniref:17959_t:CDS:1 n=1 Tax=Dentiscutata erythropus TaxID=1348616 RepID=A0A9N9HIS9_9GLOM|nr:17959_t:CDS:1 [Dentiscutata erythropus]